MKGIFANRFRGCGRGSTRSLSLRGVFVFAGLFLLGSASLLPAQTTPPQFKPPVNLGPKINSSFYDADPFWDASRKRLYFVSTRHGAEDIWFSQWTDTGWTNAQKLGPQINGSPRFEHSPSVSPDGQKLYYTRGDGSWNIWVATWDSSLNDWVNPTILPYPINTAGHEFTARISPDGLHLYFTSDGPPDSLFPSGRDGLYVSERNGSSWSAPISLGPIVNASGTEEYPSITADGRWLYFRRVVTDGTSSFVSKWTGSAWSIAIDLRPQLGGRTGEPSITPTGDSLFFTGCADFPGFGSCDVWMAERKIPPRVPALEIWSLLVLVLFLLLTGVIWIKRGKLITH